MLPSLVLVLAILPARASDPEDDDGDGYGESSGDCDDYDATVYPDAEELCDAKDNDCDEVVDEGTDCYDDDGDGQTEDEGDCDDDDPDVYTGAFETVDGMDNDCDGLIDDGTEVYDDDGDSYTESQGDCDDDDPAIFPYATEWCRDEIDNNCDGRIDPEDCVEPPDDGCDPDLQVRLDTSAFSAEPADLVEVEAVLTTSDSAMDPGYAWSVEDGVLAGAGAEMTWVLPDAPGTYTISVSVVDACDTQAIAHADVEVLDLTGAVPELSDDGGCGSGKRAASVFVGLPLLFGSTRRRRR